VNTGGSVPADKITLAVARIFLSALKNLDIAKMHTKTTAVTTAVKSKAQRRPAFINCPALYKFFIFTVMI